ncbi:MAG TPA: ECF transporter S component [Firmicutes bacterium]|nr:ECF transporter S component [Candidatus Fermentithermobacillaceae bacterium]
MRSSRTRSIAIGALGTALVATATAFLKIPIPTGYGYIHLGDGLIYGIAASFGPALATVSGGLGSGIADLLAGYPVWVPWSIVIKGLTGYLVGTLVIKRKLHRAPAMVAGALVTIAGYSLGAFVLYGPTAVPAEFLFDLIQTGSGVVVGLGISRLLELVARTLFEDQQ